LLDVDAMPNMNKATIKEIEDGLKLSRVTLSVTVYSVGHSARSLTLFDEFRRALLSAKK